MGESAGGTLVLSLALLLKEKGFSPAEALVPLSPCVTQADCFPSHTRNCGNRLRRPLCRIFPILPVPKKAGYRTKTLCLEYNGISLYGKALLPDGDGPFPTVLYTHGAESDYKADMTTLKSLAMSVVAYYTFDFYGWTSRSTVLQGVHWFHDVPRGVDSSYE